MENSTISPLQNGHIQAELGHKYYKDNALVKSVAAHRDAAACFDRAASQSTDTKLSRQLQNLATQQRIQATSVESKMHQQPRPRPQPQPQPQPSSISSSSSITSNYDDPFNKYFNTIEVMLKDISNPVAFATAPLDASANQSNDITSSYQLVNCDATDADKPTFYQTATNLLSNFKSYSLNLTPFSTEPKFSSTNTDSASFINKLINENNKLSAENTQLKDKLVEFQRRDKMHDALKGSIIKFGEEYKAHKRGLASLEVSKMDASSAASVSTQSLVMRVHQLELELANKDRELRAKDTVIKKHDQRWETLKHSNGKRTHPNARSSHHSPHTSDTTQNSKIQ